MRLRHTLPSRPQDQQRKMCLPGQTPRHFGDPRQCGYYPQHVKTNNRQNTTKIARSYGVLSVDDTKILRNSGTPPRPDHRFGKRQNEIWLDRPTLRRFPTSHKQIITIASPDTTKSFTFCSDASDTSVGASLIQEIEENVCPIVFFSRKLNSTEIRYSMFDRDNWI